MKPTFTWGQSEVLRLANTTPNPTLQLLDVALPHPAVSQIFFRVEQIAGTGTVWLVQLDLFIGIGRTTLQRRYGYPNQPSVGNPLEDDIGPIPIQKLQANVILNGDPTPDPELVLSVGLLIAPYTTIPMESPALQWAPMLPGEGGELDRSLEGAWPLGYEPMEEAIDPVDAIALRGRLRP